MDVGIYIFKFFNTYKSKKHIRLLVSFIPNYEKDFILMLFPSKISFPNHEKDFVLMPFFPTNMSFSKS